MNKFEDLIETGKIKYLHTYEIPYENDKYIVEVIETYECIEFWLSNKTYGVKSMIVGFKKEEEINILSILENIEDDIDIYKKEYEDDELIEEDLRICNECGKFMDEGYCINSGEEYYCSDECLHKHYTEEEWNEMYEDGGDSYWTEWED